MFVWICPGPSCPEPYETIRFVRPAIRFNKQFDFRFRLVICLCLSFLGKCFREYSAFLDKVETISIATEKMDKPQIIIHVQKSLNYTCFDTKWIPCSPKFVVLGSHAKGTGALQIYEISHGDVTLVKEVCE